MINGDGFDVARPTFAIPSNLFYHAASTVQCLTFERADHTRWITCRAHSENNDVTVPREGLFCLCKAPPPRLRQKGTASYPPTILMPLTPARIEPLLAAWGRGDVGARDELLKHVYGDLKRIASRHLSNDAVGHTLNTTALVHEAYLDIVGREAPSWQGRAQFFAFMSTVMRHVLIDHARHRVAEKRGGEAVPVILSEALVGHSPDLHDILDIDAAFEKLAAHAPRLAQVAECRLYGGMNDADIAEALGTSERTAARDWQRARAWLRVALEEGDGE